MAKVDAAVDGEVSLSSSAPPNHGMNTMTQGPVEARSLSSITTIASNPPSYPRNPAQKKLDPLELYIVRVPGSKGEAEKTKKKRPIAKNYPSTSVTGEHRDGILRNARKKKRMYLLTCGLYRCVPVAS